jgi:hypothetical protein
MELTPFVLPPLNRSIAQSLLKIALRDRRRPQLPTLELIVGPHDAAVVMGRISSDGSETSVTVW